ncbi:hypothetical protein H6P81_015883 [Aristolochia fimbriata]|uniref:Uncharacterized protein n=1 Tax=Aristolochia fimbriata TaxID=158543 RepID=A0AAV7EBD5_ARIFI|nr:hypothetical protein H6P81_015883 [Aristolochia fimbriata]
MAPGKRPPPLPECSSSNIPEIGIEGVVDSSTAGEPPKIILETQLQASMVPRKCGRGPSRGLIVEKLYEKLGHKIQIEFDATSRRPKGRYNGEFRTYRRELSAWFQQHGGDPEGRLTPFPDVNGTDWQWLCENIFATKSFQDRSALNKVNISKLKVRHIVGQKLFQRLFDEMSYQSIETNTFFKERSLGCRGRRKICK